MTIGKIHAWGEQREYKEGEKRHAKTGHGTKKIVLPPRACNDQREKPRHTREGNERRYELLWGPWTGAPVGTGDKENRLEAPGSREIFRRWPISSAGTTGLMKLVAAGITG